MLYNNESQQIDMQGQQFYVRSRKTCAQELQQSIANYLARTEGKNATDRYKIKQY